MRDAHAAEDIFQNVAIKALTGEISFETIRPAIEFPSGEDFEVLLDPRDFRLDPSLVEIKDKLPSVPLHLVVESIWSHTLDQPSGLEITEVELLPPTTSLDPSPTELPVMDIWAATSQGDLRTVKCHLAAGTDIDAAFIGPGIPASGATPLDWTHYEHLSESQARLEVAELLRGAGGRHTQSAHE
ncbi:MAG: hypothetical protein JSW27_04510 [Phycisphaerales bacterium]|nr:MAG: hypothetical protein JSW27_04510 [Phycisphaerales bacterium]